MAIRNKTRQPASAPAGSAAAAVHTAPPPPPPPPPPPDLHAAAHAAAVQAPYMTPPMAPPGPHPSYGSTYQAPQPQPPQPPQAPPAEAHSHPGMGHNQGPPMVPGRVVGFNRAGKPVQRAAAETGVNEFHVPSHLPPPGWSWEWKRESTRNQVDPYYISRLNQVGWEPVRYESYPGVFAPQFDDQGKPVVGPVRRNGLMLMERDMRLTIEAKLEEKRKADERVGNSRRQYTRLDTGGTTTAEFDEEAQRASYIKQSVEPVMAPPTAAQTPNRMKID